MPVRASHHLVMSLAGEDRVGIVKDFTAIISSHGANVEESRMAMLGGDFAILARITLQQATDVSSVTKAVEKTFPDFSVSCRETTAPLEGPLGPKRSLWTMLLESPDQPGIVAAVTQALATHGGNVHEIDTETKQAPFASYPLFTMNATFAVNDTDLDSVSSALTKVEDKFGAVVSLQAEKA